MYTADVVQPMDSFIISESQEIMRERRLKSEAIRAKYAIATKFDQFEELEAAPWTVHQLLS